MVLPRNQAQVYVESGVQFASQRLIVHDRRALFQQHAAVPANNQVADGPGGRELLHLQRHRRLASEAKEAERHGVPELDVQVLTHQHDGYPNSLQGL